MSKRAWFAAIAVGLIITLSSGYGWYHVRIYQIEKADQRQSVAEADTRNVYDCFRRAETPALIMCLYEVTQSDPDTERSNYDLQAQQEMAIWAYGMLLVGIVSAAITGIGVIFVAMTLRETIATTRAAIEGANFAREQVEVARLANEFAKAEAERQFDPYLFVAEATYGPMSDTWPGTVVEGQYWISVTIKNDSSWPAFIKRTWIQEFVFHEGELVGGGGGGGYGVTAALKPGDVRVVEMTGARDGDPPATQTFIGVRFQYDTVDGRQRHKDFWLRKAHEYGRPGEWWLDRLDDAPAWLAELPEASKGPWGSVGNRMPTEE